MNIRKMSGSRVLLSPLASYKNVGMGSDPVRGLMGALFGKCGFLWKVRSVKEQNLGIKRRAQE